MVQNTAKLKDYFKTHPCVLKEMKKTHIYEKFIFMNIKIMVQTSGLQVLSPGKGVKNAQGYSACTQQLAGQVLIGFGVSVHLMAVMTFNRMNNLVDSCGSTF